MPRLRFMDIAIDYNCNMTCDHCSALPMKDPEEKRLTLDEYARIARELQDEGCLIFHFTGGEPLLRKNLEEIIRAFRPERCAISIQTNGWLVTRERLRSLKAAGLDMMCVSIDSGIPEEHDAFRKTPGAHARAVAAVRMAREEGLKHLISTCVSRDNLRSEGIRRLIAFAEETGSWCHFNLAVPVGHWQGRVEMMFRPEDREEMLRMMDQHPCIKWDMRGNWLRVGCGAVKEKLYLSPYGNLMPCPFIQIALGNLRSESLRQVRDRSLACEEFRTYAPLCLAAEDADFVARTPCYLPGNKKPITSYRDVTWLTPVQPSSNPPEQS
ncbi:MAG: radical SAM protein [Magnetococcales bacterium]|nr:radical SAM protein [Magnetococcales bacterium]